MAATFGVAPADEAAFERDVVDLIHAGNLKARVDDIEKVRPSREPAQRTNDRRDAPARQVLYAVDPDKRRKLYRETLETGQTIQESTRQAFLRMQLYARPPTSLGAWYTDPWLRGGRHQAGILIETPQERRKREGKMQARAAGREDDPAYFEGSDEEMLQTA